MKNNKAKENETKTKNLTNEIKVGELNKKEGIVFFGTCHCSGVKVN